MSKTSILALSLLLALSVSPFASGQGKPPAALIEYMGRVQAQIQTHWSETKIAKPASKNPRVRFTVTPDGHIENPHISQTSMSEQIDTAAINCVKESAPFPALPSGAPKDGVEIDMGLNVTLVKKDDESKAAQSEAARAKANRLVQDGDWQGAVKTLSDFLATSNDDYLVRNQIVDIYVNQASLTKSTDPKAALDLLEKAGRINPDSPAVKELTEELSKKSSDKKPRP